MAQGLTYEDVSKAADELDADGCKPTAQRIRAKLGQGSFSTILKHLRTWDEQKQRAAGGPPTPKVLEEMVSTTVTQVWNKLHDAAQIEVAAAEERAANAEAAAEAEKAERARLQESLDQQLAAFRNLDQERQRLQVDLAAERRGREAAEQLVATMEADAEEAADKAAAREDAQQKSLEQERARMAELVREHAAVLQEQAGTIAELRERAGRQDQTIQDLRLENTRLVQENEAAVRERDQAFVQGREARQHYEHILARLDQIGNAISLAKTHAPPTPAPAKGESGDPSQEQVLAGLRALKYSSLEAARKAMGNGLEARKLVETVRGKKAAKRRDTGYLQRYRQQVTRWLGAVDPEVADAELARASE